MNFTEFRDALFSASLAAGCAAAEVCLTEGEDFEVRVLDGALDSYSVSRSAGLGLRVLLAGKNGYAYTERFEDAAALVRRAMDNARAIESADDHPMQGAQTYVEVTPPPEPLVAMDEREKIELCREMERLTKAEDPRVQQVAYNIVSSGRGTVRIHNTLGLHAERPLAAGASLVVAVLRDGAEVRDGSGYRLGAASADVAACAKEAVREAAALMGAKSVPAGSYRVLLRND
ncbi:MAG TPA: DNA gyrase modulator, partial [Oscillospiraceae bacterium]|nr:DNA gyrase modulator [Oscillospiraceae bacterium]